MLYPRVVRRPSRSTAGGRGHGGQYRDGDAGGDRGTARQTAGSGAQGSRGQEGAADAAADAKDAGEPASKKGSAARSSRPPGRAAQRADLVTELDGTPVRDAYPLFGF